MNIRHEQKKDLSGIKFVAEDDGGKAIGRAFLYVLKNDLHREPFGFLEDVFVEEAHRGRGLGGDLVKAVVAEAKARGCYKLICTSRHSNAKAKMFYEKFGFRDHGAEFRMDF